MEVPDKLMGVVIGKGGETIKALQSTHGVRIKYVRETGFITLMADERGNIVPRAVRWKNSWPSHKIAIVGVVPTPLRYARERRAHS